MAAKKRKRLAVKMTSRAKCGCKEGSRSGAVPIKNEYGRFGNRAACRSKRSGRFTTHNCKKRRHFGTA